MLARGRDADEAVSHLLSLPYATSAAYCMPHALMMCCGMAPCARTPSEAASVRAAVVAQGVVPAAVKALQSGCADGVVAGLMVLEQYVVFDAAGAVAAGAIPAVRAAFPVFMPAAGEGMDADTASGKAQVAALAACALATLAAFAASGLDAPSRVALAQEAVALLVPFTPLFPQMPWDGDTLNRMAARFNAVINITNAVIAGGGAPVPLVLSNPADIPLKLACGPTYMVNTLADSYVFGGFAKIATIYLTAPPMRITVGEVQTVIPKAQAMDAEEAQQSPAEA
jgi:hypothetical protein